MGFSRRFKRNQIEDAILATLRGHDGDAESPDLRVRIKRLLDADRLLEPEVGSGRHEPSYAFYSNEAPGSGKEVWFSSYEAFALLVALRLLGHGWPQGTVVRVMRQVRQQLEPEHRRILEQDPDALFDPEEVRRRATPGAMATNSVDPVFLA